MRDKRKATFHTSLVEANLVSISILVSVSKDKTNSFYGCEASVLEDQEKEGKFCGKVTMSSLHTTSVALCVLLICLFDRNRFTEGFLVEVNTTVKVAEVDTAFLSVALDSEQIANDLARVPFDSPRFVTLCKGLSQININRPMLYLRIGGSKGDDIVFKQLGLDINSEKYVLNGTEWDTINNFAMKMQWKFIFGLNSLERKNDGSWDPTNFIMLMRYTSSKGYLVNYELGNGTHLCDYCATYVFKISSCYL